MLSGHAAQYSSEDENVGNDKGRNEDNADGNDIIKDAIIIRMMWMTIMGIYMAHHSSHLLLRHTILIKTLLIRAFRMMMTFRSMMIFQTMKMKKFRITMLCNKQCFNFEKKGSICQRLFSTSSERFPSTSNSWLGNRQGSNGTIYAKLA